jgi:hypothetical protein
VCSRLTVVIIDLCIQAYQLSDTVWAHNWTYNNQVTELEVTSQTCSFASDTFHEAAVTSEN